MRGVNEAVARVADQRRARIAYEGDGFAFLEFADELVCRLVLVVIMERIKGRFDAEMR